MKNGIYFSCKTHVPVHRDGKSLQWKIVPTITHNITILEYVHVDFDHLHVFWSFLELFWNMVLLEIKNIF